MVRLSRRHFVNNNLRISTNKILSLLYYAQGCSFQRFEAPLFLDKFEVWKNGPVIRSIVQHDVKTCDSNEVILDAETERIILDVAREYGVYTEEELLEQVCCADSPWNKTYKNGERYIQNELIQEWFDKSVSFIPELNLGLVLSDIPTVDLRGDWV